MKKIKIFLLMAALGVSVLTGCGNSKSDSADNSNPKVAEESKDSKTEDKVAGKDEMTTAQDVVDDSMKPISGDKIKDGTYSIDVASSSSMFKIVSCELTVKEGKMTAVMTMSGKGYLKLYMGTGEEAVAASDDDCIPFVENENGEHTFTVPVEELDKAVDCTAFSKNKEKWYDRTLVFKADKIPVDCLEDGVLTDVSSLNLEDGKYTADVSMTGGSGRAEISTPVAITVTDGKAVATIEWSSPNYDYMKVNEQKYLPANTEGNSIFEIPVEYFDWKISVIADTVAMSEPHEIEYTLLFDSASLQKAD